MHELSEDDHRLNALLHMDEARKRLNVEPNEQALIGHALMAIAEAQYAQWEILVQIRNEVRDTKPR